MPIPTLIASTTASAGGASPAIVTTGADFLITAVSFGDGVGNTSSMTDSKTNTWHALNKQSLDAAFDRYATQFFYAFNAIVGTGHTFGPEGGSNGAVQVAAFKGLLTASDPFDQQNGGSNNTSISSKQVGTGFITPTANYELIVTACGIDDPSGNIITCPGFNIINIFDVIVGATYGVALAWTVQRAKTHVGATWFRSLTEVNSGDSAIIASFKSTQTLVNPHDDTRWSRLPSGILVDTWGE